MAFVHRRIHLHFVVLAGVLLTMILMSVLSTGSAFAAQKPPKHHHLTHPSVVGVGVGPDAVAMGDFNRDGKLDMAVVNSNQGTVSVFLGRGDGTFSAPVTFAVGRYPDAIAVGDFNGDGKLDLVVANNASATVSVLQGNGDGTFAPQVTYSVGHIPTSVAVGDFNGDGKLDLAVANSSDATVSILLGNGDGTFASQVTYSTGSGAPSIAVGDFNRDGKLDLVAVNPSTNSVSVLTGNGDGTFAAPVSYPAGNGVTSVAVGDFNGDGKLDLVTTSTVDNIVGILPGNGDGTFAPPVTYPVGNQPTSVATGDFNDDGKLDLVTTNAKDNTISVLLGNGDGTFASQVTYPVGNDPAAVAIGDLNDDGNLDLAVVNHSDNDVSVLLGNGDGTFTPNLLHVTPQNITETAGVPFTTNLASMIGVQQVGDLTVTLFWNDETPNTSGIVSGNDPYTISGSHTYSKPGNYTIYVEVADSNTGQTVYVNVAATVVANSIALTGQQVTATEGSPFSGVVATGTVNGTVGTLSAFITWGDGQVSAGTITNTGQTTFTVSGTHTYAEEGEPVININVLDNEGHSATATSPAVVSDAPLTLTHFKASSPKALLGSVKATFTDADPGGTLSDYSATINWGDGNTVPVTIVAGKSGTWNISATHTYAQAGKYSVTLTVSDSGGSQVAKKVTITVK